MKHFHMGRNVQWRHLSLLRSSGAPQRNCGSHDIDGRYRITAFRTLIHRAVRALPPALREPVAEYVLRRASTPGPAAEHVVQYLLSAAKAKRKTHTLAEATVAKGADNFYDRQYRQFLNPVMGAFAMTATRALLASGGPPGGLLWRRRRKTFAAMLDESSDAPPILVIDRETVAVPILLPSPETHQDRGATERWLGGRGGMPACYLALLAGEDVHCREFMHGRASGAPMALFSKLPTLQFTPENSLCWRFTRATQTRWACISHCSRWRRSQPISWKSSMASPPMLSIPGGKPHRAGPHACLLCRRHRGGLYPVLAKSFHQAATA